MRRAVATALLLLVSACGVVYAQSPTGAINGRVMDPTGAAVAGALVSITNPQTGETRALQTSPEGMYAASALPPGEYHVTVEVPGFTRLDRRARVEAGTTTSVDLSLELGSVADSVTVQRAVPLLHYRFTDSQVQRFIGSGSRFRGSKIQGQWFRVA